MPKKKKILIIVSILLAILLSFIGGQAFSKYLTKVNGKGIAEVATWDFKVNGKTDAVQTINLGSTCDNETLVGNKIAPGTKGSFNIVVDASDSDVGIQYKIEFENESSKPDNLKFKYNENEYSNITDLANDLTGNINADDENKTKTFTINWEWKYETGNNEQEITKNDIIDTNNAKEISNYTFDVNVQGTQVVPQ